MVADKETSDIPLLAAVAVMRFVVCTFLYSSKLVLFDIMVLVSVGLARWFSECAVISVVVEICVGGEVCVGDELEAVEVSLESSFIQN